jgi:thiamine-phosphate pyrophosphorylase
VSLHSEQRRPILCYVTDRRSLTGLAGAASSDVGDRLLERIEAAAVAGVDWIQIREKDLSGGELTTLVRSAIRRARAAGPSTHILVNDRVDVALAAEAHGVHLGESAIPVQGACRLRKEFFRRRGSPRNFMIGASCHSLSSALAAANAGAEYLYFGPIFDTPSKAAFGPAQGVDLLAKVCGAVQIPVLAIGGVTPANARDCLAAGATGIAAIRLFQEPGELRGIVATLRALCRTPNHL